MGADQVGPEEVNTQRRSKRGRAQKSAPARLGAAGASMARGEMVGFDGRRCGVTNSAALIGGSKKSPAQRGLRLSE